MIRSGDDDAPSRGLIILSRVFAGRQHPGKDRRNHDGGCEENDRVWKRSFHRAQRQQTGRGLILLRRADPLRLAVRHPPVLDPAVRVV